MRAVIILGFNEDQNTGVVNKERWPGNEIWTLNDWWNYYQRFDNPDRVYQIHDHWDGRNKSHPWRDSPDWRRRYEESGAECVLSTPEGLTRERIFDINRAEAEFGKFFLGSTLSHMLVESIWEGAPLVEFKGVKMLGDQEHLKQVPNLLWNMETARERGVKIICSFEVLWREMFAKAGIKWQELKEVSLRYGSKIENGIVDMVINQIPPTVELGR